MRCDQFQISARQSCANRIDDKIANTNLVPHTKFGTNCDRQDFASDSAVIFSFSSLANRVLGLMFHLSTLHRLLFQNFQGLHTNGSDWTSSVGHQITPSINLTSLVNVSSPNEWDPHCAAVLFGSNLNIDSCLRAFESMSRSTEQSTYRDRVDPHPSDDKCRLMLSIEDDGTDVASFHRMCQILASVSNLPCMVIGPNIEKCSQLV